MWLLMFWILIVLLKRGPVLFKKNGLKLLSFIPPFLEKDFQSWCGGPQGALPRCFVPA